MAMASFCLTPPFFLRVKPYGKAQSVVVATVFILLASLMPLTLNARIRERRGEHEHYSNTPSWSYPRNRNKSWFVWNQDDDDVIYDFRRHLGGPEIDQDRHGVRVAHFRPGSNSNPKSHPSKPDFVLIDEETDTVIRAVEYTHENHPLHRLKDMRERIDPERESVFFFVVPKARGGIIKALMTNCYNLRRTEKRKDPESLTFIGGVLNVDTQTRVGLARSRANNIIDSGLLDAIITSHFYQGMMLFKPQHKGRAFTIMQHPVLTAEHRYRSQPKDSFKSFSSFLDSPHYIDNWVVRSLSNAKTGVLSDGHLMAAKGILARKFFVGIAEHLEETLKRLEMYYGWKECKEGCVSHHLDNELVGEQASIIERGGYEWQLVIEKDNYDIMLYYYALELFAKQGSTKFNRPYIDKTTGKPVDFAERKRKREEAEQIKFWELLGGI